MFLGQSGYELCHAAEAGDVLAVLRLIKKGTSVNSKNRLGCSALHQASRNGHEAVVQLLLEYGAYVNLNSLYGSPLHYASQNGYEAVVQLLLEHRAFINLTSQNGFSPLQLACRNGHKAVVQLLVEHRANVNLTSRNGFSPLHYASQNGYEAVVQLLLEYGANVNPTTQYDYSPLHCACQNGHEAVVQLLLEHGANVNLTTQYGSSPLHSACQNGHEAVMYLLLEAGANVDCVDFSNETLLLRACKNRHHSMVQLLIEHGANMNLTSGDGFSPLHYACLNSDEAVVRLLLEAGSDVNCMDFSNETSLLIACKNGHYSIVQLLLAHGANVILASQDGFSPLHHACWNGNEAIVSLLLKKKSVADCIQNFSNTPLTSAAERGHEAVVDHLLQTVAETDPKKFNDNISVMAAAVVEHALDKCLSISVKCSNIFWAKWTRWHLFRGKEPIAQTRPDFNFDSWDLLWLMLFWKEYNSREEKTDLQMMWQTFSQLVRVLYILLQVFNLWFFEWPDRRRLLSTTMPWNVKVSLLVLWGVCWMFYDNGLLDGDYDFVPELNYLDKPPSLAVPSSDHNGLVPNFSPASGPLFSGYNIQPMITPRVTRALNAADNPFGSTLSSSTHLLGSFDHLLDVEPWNSIEFSAKPPEQFRTTFELDCGMNVGINPILSGHLQPVSLFSEEFGAQQIDRYVHTKISDLSGDTPYSAFPGIGHFHTNDIHGLDPIPFGDIESPRGLGGLSGALDHPFNQMLGLIQDESLGNMHEPADSEELRAFLVAEVPIASSGNIAGIPGSLDELPFDASANLRPLSNLNTNGPWTCTVKECKRHLQQFRHKSLYIRHTDTHERRFKCKDVACTTRQGFTSAHGLTRHEKEVHKIQIIPGSLRYCPYANCSRGEGSNRPFSRKANLEEHMRRLHRRTERVASVTRVLAPRSLD